MKRFLLRMTQISLLVVCAFATMGCWGLGEGIHTSRDSGLSTSRFRTEYEVIPNAVVMREDTEPRWQLGRYVFVRGADQVVVISRITSWSDNATKRQRKSGDIPDMKDQILERLWITIPQGTEVGQELDLHALSYRFLASYDRGNVGDEQFARPFRVLGNIRITEIGEGYVRMRVRIRLTSDLTTAWEIFENDLKTPLAPDGKYGKQAEPDAVIYSLSRPGELPTPGLTPVQMTPEMTQTPSSAGPLKVTPETPGTANNAATEEARKAAAAAAAPPAMLGSNLNDAQPPVNPADPAKPAVEAAPAAVDANKPADETAAVKGKWYSRTPAWEVFVQLNDDGSFVHSAARPLAVPAVVKGEWRVRGGYLVLRIQSLTIEGKSHMAMRKDNPYAMLKLQWDNDNTVIMDGDMPGPNQMNARYEMHRAEFPDMNFIPAITYRPDSPEPRYVGKPNAAAQPAEASDAAPDAASEPAP